MNENIYGKSVGEILKIKNDFFEHNDKMLELSSHQADALLRQPERKVCKICGEPISGEKLYTSQRMDYFLCGKCGHVNSRYEDTPDFAKAVYITDNYEYNYSEADKAAYLNRMENIYIPKAKFLLDTLKGWGLGQEDIKLLDDGAGSGYFVRACQELGIRALGIEISKAQVEFANKMAEAEILRAVDSEAIAGIIEKADFNVLSGIGVFEHIINLDEILSAIRRNSNIEYVYLSVPCFSMSCVFEAANQHCYNRHAGGTHTHLFSDKSLEFMAEKMGFSVGRTWKFGSDMMDMYRMLCVSLDQNGNSALKEYFAPKFLNMIDDLQLVVDKNEFASEVHAILRRKA